MAKRYNIVIEKIGSDEYLIHKNMHLEFLIKGCHEFYYSIVQHMSMAYQEQYVEKPEFIELMKILLDETEFATINSKDLVWLYDWVDVIINIIIEMDTPNFKDKQMKRFFKTAENFISEINKFNLKSENIKKW